MKLSFNPRRGQSRLQLKVKGLPPASDYAFWAETAPGSGVMASSPAGQFSADAKKAVLDLNTARGDPLPSGAVRITSLRGCTVEVRSREGDTYLVGFVP